MLVKRKRDGNIYHVDPKTTYIDPSCPHRGDCMYLVPHWTGGNGQRSHYKSVARYLKEYVELETGEPVQCLNKSA